MARAEWILSGLFVFAVFATVCYLTVGRWWLDDNLVEAVIDRKPGATEAVTRLLDMGANPNAAPEGFPVIVTAAGSSQGEIVTILLERGANINARSPEGYTALGAAEAEQDSNMVSLLRVHGAKR